MTKLTYGMAALLLALCTPPVKAAITYTYVGNNYTVATAPYTTAMAITGSFTFTSPLAPNIAYPETATPATWSISDGVETITNDTGPLFFNVGTDSSGNIRAWNFATGFSAPTGFLVVFSGSDPTPPSIPCGGNVCDGIYGVAAGHAVGIAGVIDDPGVWTSTPEPSSLSLMAIGIFGMAYVARKRWTLAHSPATRKVSN